MPLRLKNHSHSPDSHAQSRRANRAGDRVAFWEEKGPAGAWGRHGDGDVVVQSIEDGGLGFCGAGEDKGTTTRTREKRKCRREGSDDDNDDGVGGDRKRRRG